MPLRMSGLSSGIDTDSVIQELMSAQRSKLTKIENKQTKLTWKQDIWKDLNKKLYSFYTGELTKLKTQGSYVKRKVSSNNESAVTATAASSASIGSHTLEVKELASAQYVTGGQINTASTSTKLSTLGIAEGTTITIGDGEGNEKKTLTIDANTTISDFVNACKEAGLNASFDTKQKRFFISSKDSGANQAFTLTADVTNATNTTEEVDEEGNTILVTTAATDTADDVMAKLGLSQIIKEPDTVDANGNTVKGSLVAANTSGMSFVAAQNAKIVLDGAEMEDSSNSFSVNGLTLELKSVTTSSVKLNVTNDVDAVYDMVKSFVKKYNELLDEMNTLYSASYAKGYEPLTDEEREAMTDDQIEKWETKIKDSLLRRDSTINSITTGMRNAMLTTVKVNGKAYSLASIGIVTSSDYTEKGKLHIYGDEEEGSDSKVTLASGSVDLRKALEENPEAVMEVLTAAGKALYDDMTKKMTRTSLSSALTFYNDKQMDKLQTQYKKDISTMEKKLQDMEDRYYKQFSAMETAMAKLQQQSNYLSSMLGTSN